MPHTVVLLPCERLPFFASVCCCYFGVSIASNSIWFARKCCHALLSPRKFPFGYFRIIFLYFSNARVYDSTRGTRLSQIFKIHSERLCKCRYYCSTSYCQSFKALLIMSPIEGEGDKSFLMRILLASALESASV